MISHALTILVNALNQHLTQTYGIHGNHAPAGLRNLSSTHFPTEVSAASATQECLNLTLVGLQEESANYHAPRPGLTRASVPPLNLQVLLTPPILPIRKRC